MISILTPQDEIILLNKVYEFIRTHKKSGITLVDLILDFCDMYNDDEVEIGEIISKDKYLKKFIMVECKRNNIIKDIE